MKAGRRRKPPKQPGPVKLCAFCGQRPGIERGHVIPKRFLATLPVINLRVPSCPECERGGGDGVNRPMNMDEEYVRNILCMDINTEHHPVARQLLVNKVFKSLEHSPRLKQNLLNTVEWRMPEIESGIVLPLFAPTFGINTDRVKRVFRKITKGLYYANNKATPLPDNYEVEVWPQIPHGLFYKYRDAFFAASHVGPFSFGTDNVFSYMAARRPPPNEHEQYYLMVLYGNHTALAFTRPKDGPHGVVLSTNAELSA